MTPTTRPMAVLKYPSYEPLPKTEAEINQLDLSAAAKAVPDALIENDPSLIAAKAQADAWEVRLTRLETHPGKHLIGDLVSTITDELAKVRLAYRFACLDDFLNGSLDFDGEAAIASERVAVLERRLHAAKTASNDLNRRGSQLNELRDLRDQAKANLQNIRFELRKQAVLARQQVATTDTD